MRASKSSSSPAKYNPFTSFDCIVRGSICDGATPPRVTTASSTGRSAAGVMTSAFNVPTSFALSSRLMELTGVLGSIPDCESTTESAAQQQAVERVFDGAVFGFGKIA